MLVFKRLFRFYINASIHVALAVVSLYFVSVRTLNIIPDGYLLGFLFFATIVCYNFVKYGVEAEKYLIVAKPSHRPIQAFSFLAFGFSLFFFFHLKPMIWGYVVFLTFVSALYAIPFLPRSKNLRSWGGLKIFLVALIWTGFTYVLPIIDNGIETSFSVFAQGIKRFLLVLVLILPFEIRDLKYDKPALRTLPQRYGVEQTKRWGYVLALAYFSIALLDVSAEWEDMVFAIMVTLILILVTYNAAKEQTKYYASFWVEGIPIIMVFIGWAVDWVVN
jgi:hypothetical protein